MTRRKNQYRELTDDQVQEIHDLAQRRATRYVKEDFDTLAQREFEVAKAARKELNRRQGAQGEAPSVVIPWWVVPFALIFYFVAVGIVSWTIGGGY